MDTTESLISKVLIYEPEPEHQAFLKNYCDQSKLLGLRVDSLHRIFRVLEKNVDLGAILISEETGNEMRNVAMHHIVAELIRERPELPILMRKRTTNEEVAADYVAPQCTAMYTPGDSDELDILVNEFIFNRYYPTDVIRDIQHMTRDTIAALFHDFTVKCDSPHLTRDRILYGEVSSLMRLESHWCRGYMMLETREETMLQVIRGYRISGLPLLESGEEINFRTINQIMSELTNTVWGKLKAGILQTPTGKEDRKYRAEIPSVINNIHNYISFGTDSPKLCFRYVLIDNHKKMDPFVLQQRFAFNLRWKPEDLTEADKEVKELVDCGDVMFL
jgi:hypothetical protein